MGTEKEVLQNITASTQETFIETAWGKRKVMHAHKLCSQGSLLLGGRSQTWKGDRLADQEGPGDAAIMSVTWESDCLSSTPAFKS